MSILARLAILFVVVPLLELALLVRLGQLLGFWTTIGVVILTGVAGALLARAEGFRTLWTLRSDLARGRLPHQAMLDGASVLVGGALLLTPGLLTDGVGFALLFPPTRRWVQRRFLRRLEGKVARGEIRVGVFRSGASGASPTEAAGTDAPEQSPDRRMPRKERLSRPPEPQSFD